MFRMGCMSWYKTQERDQVLSPKAFYNIVVAKIGGLIQYTLTVRH